VSVRASAREDVASARRGDAVGAIASSEIGFSWSAGREESRVTTRAMGDRSAQIAMEWVCKCADVVVEAREAESGREGRGGSMKANRWFNAPTSRRRETTRVAAGGREDDDGSFGGGGGGGGGFRERVVVLDVFLEREASSNEDEDVDEDADEDATPANERAPPPPPTTTSGRRRELVERWAFHAGADGESVGGNNHFNKDLETSVVYKRAVVMIRTLIALSRTLPTHGARLRAMRRRGMRGGKLSSGVTLAFELRDAGERMDLASAHPGKALGFQTFAFADVPTSIGKLRACVYFLDQMAVHALEEAFIVADEAMHAAAAVAVESPENVSTTPNAHRAANRLDASLGPDVALAGGEMSLSPSPSGKGDDCAARSGDRRRQSAGLTRGLLFDDASPSQSARPPAPTRGGMTASLSSGSLQVKPSVSPAAVPLADYTSPNYQRFDNAPSSAPSAGPAPIYGFNASPTIDTRKTNEETNASARPATKVEPSLASTKRRSTMSSCLKIDDAYASRKNRDDRGGAAAGAAASPIIGTASSPIFAPGAAKRTTAVSTPPSSGGVFPRASPIACSPGLPHASPQSTPESRGGPGSHARYASGSPSPWGGFVCPESPVPGFFGGTSPGSAARSSPSSSSLGTSLRDVVGVYPHSPGGVSAAAAAFARRMSGASDDIGSPLSRDDETDFPFAFDDADPHATSVEHTPADLLHLLEDSSTLRRKSTDGPLPLDAALDDDDDDARDAADENDAPVARLKASVADAPRERAGLTLSDALDALRELKPPRDDR